MIVWLASYPRSGNTFLRVILNTAFQIKTYSVYDDTSDIAADEDTSEIVGHQLLPADFDLVKARAAEQVYYLKTHERHDQRIQDEDKVIYLIRDGREASLSLSRHLSLYGSKEVFFQDVVYGNCFAGSWGEHVASWRPRERTNILLIQFEELTAQPDRHLAILGDFLGLTASPAEEGIPDFAQLHQINPKFFRTGKTSSWERRITPAEHFSFWLKHGVVMQEYGYLYRQPEFFSADLADQPLLLELARQNDYILQRIMQQQTTSGRNTAGLRGRLTEQHGELEQLRKLLQDRDSQLERRNAVLEQRSSELAEQAQELEQLRKLLQDRDSQLERRNAVLEQRSSELAEQAQELEQLRKLLQDRDSQLERRNAVLGQRSSELTEQAQELERLRGLLQSKNQEIPRLKNLLEDKNSLLAKQKQHIENCQLKINSFNDQLIAKEQTLKEIQAHCVQQIAKLETLRHVAASLTGSNNPAIKYRKYKELLNALLSPNPDNNQ